MRFTVQYWEHAEPQSHLAEFSAQRRSADEYYEPLARRKCPRKRGRLRRSELRNSISPRRESHRIISQSSHQVPGSGSDVKIGEVVEAESGIQNAGRSSKSLPHHQWLTINGLPRAQTVLSDLGVLQKEVGQIQVSMKTGDVLVGGQTAEEQCGNQMPSALQPYRVGIDRTVSHHGAKLAETGIGHAGYA